MKWQKINIEKLCPAGWNYKQNDKTIERALTRSINEFGVVENLVVREISNNKYEVINGNHRLDVLKKQNIDEVLCCIVDVDDNKAKALAICLNELHFKIDIDKLGEIIEDVVKSNVLDDEFLEGVFNIDFENFKLLDEKTNIKKTNESDNNISLNIVIKTNTNDDFYFVLKTLQDEREFESYEQIIKTVFNSKNINELKKIIAE